MGLVAPSSRSQLYVPPGEAQRGLAGTPLRLLGAGASAGEPLIPI